jgi:hypothetical protein
MALGTENKNGACLPLTETLFLMMWLRYSVGLGSKVNGLQMNRIAAEH